MVVSGSHEASIVAHLLILPLRLELELHLLLLVRLLDVTDEALFGINFLYQFVLQMDHAPLQLLEFEPILTLHFLSGDLEDVGKITLEHINCLAFLMKHSLESILACA